MECRGIEPRKSQSPDQPESRTPKTAAEFRFPFWLLRSGDWLLVDVPIIGKNVGLAR